MDHQLEPLPPPRPPPPQSRDHQPKPLPHPSSSKHRLSASIDGELMFYSAQKMASCLADKTLINMIYWHNSSFHASQKAKTACYCASKHQQTNTSSHKMHTCSYIYNIHLYAWVGQHHLQTCSGCMYTVCMHVYHYMHGCCFLLLFFWGGWGGTGGSKCTQIKGNHMQRSQLAWKSTKCANISNCRLYCWHWSVDVSFNSTVVLQIWAPQDAAMLVHSSPVKNRHGSLMM